jgi:putative peptidoglycan lipid II flippase
MSRQVRIASLIWGASILLTKVIGIVREAVIGRVMGGGGSADIYWVAFTIPDWLNYLLAGGAMSILFIPLFTAHLVAGREDEGWRSFSAVANAMLLLLGLVTPLIWLLVPVISPMVAPGFGPDQLEELNRLTRIVLPAQIFHIVGGLLSAALQARDRHALPALSPLVYSGSMILGGLIGRSPEGFAWGALVGSALGPFGLPLIGNLRLGLRWRPILDFSHPDFRTWIVRALPVMVGASVVAVDDWVLRHQASLLAEGAISSLQYAKTLMKVPMLAFGFAAGAAAFPTITRMVAAGDRKGAFETLAGSIRGTLVLALGSQVALTAAGPEISRVIYGARLPEAQHATIGAALGLFGLGLWAWSSQTLINRGFYALGQSWKPTVVGTAVLLLCLPVYVGLRQSIGVLGLPIATSVALSVYTLALYLLLRREYPEGEAGFGRFALQNLPGLLGGLALGYALRPLLAGLEPALLRGALIGGASGLAWLGLGLWLGPPELRGLASRGLGALRRRLGRT